MSARRTRRPTAGTVIKDWGLYLLGVGLIIYEAAIVPPRDFNLTVMLLGASLAGVPGVSQLLALLTGGRPSQDPPPESRSRPSPSPSGSEADR